MNNFNNINNMKEYHEQTLNSYKYMTYLFNIKMQCSDFSSKIIKLVN
ncbi:Uncharacterised protein [Escherichia coli]|uniref:Uncharacterized protein n=1 Tax=Escherichia coli HVH 36 (4-5675286) TaxID=1280986 RepID=A0A7U9ITB5_ECOLX|nr:hypothetical protein G711_05117 [Escherichia coli HVH 36 (4-5675286)]CTS27650.1 Uncharacterised protein [Escherichia coli]CTS84605.1 Uncharacterised protein [Escherichia coli]CTS86467.1 Uncharacterised protein [Escherichia coli]CTZ16008.1 Uncharacterised protein [Escherichia coli]